MSESFGWGAPGVADASDGHDITTGLTFGVIADGSISAIKAFTPASGVTNLVFHLYEVTNQASGTLLASKTLLGVAAGALVTATLDTPVAVTTNRAYRAAVYNVDAHYVATLGAFSSADVTAGNLIAYQQGSSPFGSALSNGAFLYDSDAYPSSSGGGANFHVDVVYTPDAVTTIEGTGIANLGGLTGVATGVVTYKGSGTATLGGLTGEAQAEGRQPVPAAVSEGSWYGLLAIIQEDRQVREQDANRPLVECPLCGEPLQQVGGRLHCRFDGSLYD